MTTRSEIADNPIVISGGSGFVGSALVDALRARGDACVVLSRRGGGEHRGAAVMAYEQLPELKRSRGVVNLAGADIAGGRWSDARKRELRDSRLQTTRRLNDWAGSLATPPEFFISASAIGYYGITGESAVTENDPPGEDFGARLCRDWEAAVDPPEQTRCAITRIGVVLGPGGGALKRMLPAFRLGLGGPLGDGRQWMSWIALDDLIQLLLTIIDDEQWRGSYNAVAPEPVRNRDFARTLGQVLHRPAVLPMPAWVLRLALGEMSSLLLGSQRVLPGCVQDLDFEYRHPTLEQALQAAVQ